MKAVVLKEIGSPENLQIDNITTPEPGRGEVRVELYASALNRRDYWISLGAYPGIQCPCIPGSDGAGVVEAVGEGVDAALLGKEVIIYPASDWGDDPRVSAADFKILGMPDQGTFAEYICVRADYVVAKPGHLDWQQAAAVPLAGLTSWRAVVTQGEVQAGQTVLISGAGSGVSTFAMQWAARLQANVYVTSGSPEKITRAKSLGVIDGANYREEAWDKQLLEQTGGFDVIIDSAGGDGANRLIDLLKPAGRYVFFGATLGNPAAGIDLRKLFFRQNRIQGTTMGSPEEFSAMVDFVNRNKVEPVIDRVLPLDQVQQACTLMEGFSQMGKIVLQNKPG